MIRISDKLRLIGSSYFQQGVRILTTIVMAVLTRVLGARPGFQRVPAFVYVTGVSLLLTLLAKRVLKTLPGNTGVLLWDAAKAALASSGFYTWVTGRAGPIGTVTAADPAVANRPRPSSASVPLRFIR